jgi:hypothetical protein
MVNYLLQEIFSTVNRILTGKGVMDLEKDLDLLLVSVKVSIASVNEASNR